MIGHTLIQPPTIVSPSASTPAELILAWVPHLFKKGLKCDRTLDVWL